jgi:hypothetical protein
VDINRSSNQLHALKPGVSRRAVLGRLAGVSVAATLLAATRHPGTQAQATPGASAESRPTPNHFVLGKGETQIVYDATAFSGEPQLTYRGPIGLGPIEERPIDTVTNVGDEIRTERSEIGSLVTVYLGAMPDAVTFFLTLVLPDFNPRFLGAAPVSFATLAMLTTLRTTIAGPAPLEGALQEYVAVPLEGTAELVAS